MEKVQFQLEATLPELKDLESLKLFTKAELREVTLRRTKFESSLIKRMARKSDFFAYADYEITLEKLRKTRWRRLGYEKNPPPRSVSMHSIQRRVVYILRRATQRFPHDLGVWMAYVDYARGEGMSKVVGSGLTSALQLHPLASVLYILLSQHYLSPLSPVPSSTTPTDTTTAPTTRFSIENVSPARKTLLIGLRLLPTDQTLWREYIRLEIGWVEALRRRWRVLGIEGGVVGGDEANGEGQGKGKGRERIDFDADVSLGLPDADDSLPMQETEHDDADLGRNAFGQTGESARKAIIRGDLILTVLRSSFSNPTLGSDLSYHQSLLTMFREYPTGLRARLLNAVYENMRMNEVLKTDFRSRRVLAERKIYDRTYTPSEEILTWPEAEGWEREPGEDVPVLTGSELLLELGEAVKQMKGWVCIDEGLGDRWKEEVGLWLCKWIERMDEDASIVYLAGELRPFLQARARPSAQLLTTYTHLLNTLLLTKPSCPVLSNVDKIQSQLETFTSLHPTDPSLWSARIALESELDRPAAVRSDRLRGCYLEAMNALGATSGSAEIWEDAMEFFDELLHDATNAPSPAEEMKSHWKHALAAARRYTFESKYTRAESEDLYAHMLAAWTLSRLDLFEDELKEVRIQAMDAVLDETLFSGRWEPPVSYYGALFESLVVASSQIKAIKQRLRSVFSAWIAKSSSSEDQVAAALAWASWLVLRDVGGGAEAWKAVETLQKQLESQGDLAQGAVVRLKEGWVDILAQAEDGKDETEGTDEENRDISMETPEDASMDIE